MYHFNKKQKIILGIVSIIIAGVICYYVYAKEEDNNTIVELEDNLTMQNREIEERKEDDNDKILVHVSGAVNNEGVVELKKDSRISDAIEKARRNKRICVYERY